MKRLRTIILNAALGTIALAPAAAAPTRFSTLANFTDNGFPTGLTSIKGTLYGVAAQGTCGTVFQLLPPTVNRGPWTIATLYTFAGNGDACVPGGPPILGAGGALYGLTISGGASDAGALYELQPPASPGGPWAESVVYSFNFPDPGPPESLLVDGPDGSFYLLVEYAGGSLLQLQPPAEPGWSWNGALLWVPTGILVADDLIAGPGGSLYGAGEFGGTNQSGDVFQLTPPAAPGGAWTYTVLHSFGPEGGERPVTPNTLTLASDGTLYGTTYGSNDLGAIGTGAVFELKPPASPGGNWAYTRLHDFPGGHPDTPLVIQNGNLYGAVARPEGGLVFEMQPPSSPGGAWTTTYLHHFTNGQVPFGELVVAKDGALYGTTGTFFAPYSGTIYRIAPK